MDRLLRHNAVSSRRLKAQPTTGPAPTGGATSALQRRFPFILNTTPIRLPWDYMFTFQWTVASMRDRYALPYD